jgi:hypothetical protein
MADRSLATASPSISRRVHLSRRQCALVAQWQALGSLMVCVGLWTGMLLALGFPALTVVGGGLVLSAVVLPPLALLAMSARTGHFRRAAACGLLGVLLDAVLVLAGLVAPYDGYSLLEQIVRVVMCYAATGLLAGAAALTFGAVRALWGAGARPRPLGPRRPTPRVLMAATGASSELGHEAQDQVTQFASRLHRRTPSAAPSDTG